MDMSTMGSDFEAIQARLEALKLVALNDSILGCVFSFLKINELKSCRLVCKTWESVCQVNFNSEAHILINYQRDGKKPKDLMRIISGGSYQLPCSGLTICGLCSFYMGEDSTTMKGLLDKIGKQIKRIFIKGSGIDDRDVKVEAVQFLTSLLFRCTPNLESFQVFGYYGNVSFDPKLKLLEIHSTNRLPKLKELRMTYEGFYYKIRQNEENILSNVIKKVIQSSENLTTLTVDPAVLCYDIFSNGQLGHEVLSKIKSFRIFVHQDMWGSMDNIGDGLKPLTAQGLISLESLSFDVPPYDISAGHLWLIKFLQFQKNTLRKLEIGWDHKVTENIFEVEPTVMPEDLATSLERSSPSVPHLKELKYLDLSCPFELATFFFQNCSLWVELFPKLIKLTYAYNSSNYKELPQLVKMLLPGSNMNISQVCLKPSKRIGIVLKKKKKQVFTVRYEFSIANVKSLYDEMKLKFPNLRILKMCIQEKQTVYQYGGSMEDALQYSYI